MTAPDVRLRPVDGARYLLELAAPTPASATEARYAAWVLTPAMTVGYRATLREDGEVEVAALDAPASPAHEAALRMFARLTARGAVGRRAEGLPTWPARVLRWRADKP